MVETQVAKGLDYRLHVIAGWTGPAQVRKDSKAKSKATELDLEYVELCRTLTGPQLVGHDLKVIRQSLRTSARPRPALLAPIPAVDGTAHSRHEGQSPDNAGNGQGRSVVPEGEGDEVPFGLPPSLVRPCFRGTVPGARPVPAMFDGPSRVPAGGSDYAAARRTGRRRAPRPGDRSPSSSAQLFVARAHRSLEFARSGGR